MAGGNGHKNGNGKPFVNGSNGRTEKGTFAAGNAGGPGNPIVKKSWALKQAILRCATEKQVEEVMQALLDQAKLGDVPAAKEWLERTCGKVPKDIRKKVKHSGGVPQKPGGIFEAILARAKAEN